MTVTRLGNDFYRHDVLVVARRLVGMVLCCANGSGVTRRRITEVEAYGGESDSASHVRAGRTKRTETMYLAGGHAYVYLCYGIHHMLNVVTGPADVAQAVLIRGVEGLPGPGRLTKALGITLADNRVDLRTSARLWIEDDGSITHEVAESTRIGISYASEADQARPWRFSVELGAAHPDAS